MIIFKLEGKDEFPQEFRVVKLISRQADTILVETDTWFCGKLGTTYFVETELPSDVLVSVEFAPNNEMKPPYTFVGTIDTSIQCKKDNKSD
jgi:hypothetical protein